MRARDYVDDLASKGRYHFLSREALEAIGGSPAAAHAQLRRLRRHGVLAEPVRGFHVIVPPEYRSLGCLPPEQFVDQLARIWSEPYYVTLLSAAERHGAAHQRPQIFQVMLRKNRRAISCGRIGVKFIARSDLERMPVATFNTARGVLRYSTREVTALELVGYPDHAGGLGNVATVLGELAEEIDPDALVTVARLSPVSWAQRLGYLLEVLGKEALARGVATFVEEHARSYAPLRRAAAVAGATRSTKWRLILNADLDADA